MTHRATVSIAVACCVLTAVSLLAITYADVEVSCPIDGTKNKFSQWVSYGGYVYAFPSKYQLLFFPDTSPYGVWSCHKCRFTAFPYDFEEFPKDKVKDVLQTLHGLGLKPAADKDYKNISVTERMVIAERVYKTLGRDDYFWCQFYRLQGYFLEQADKGEDAAAARRKALEIAERMQAAEEHKGIRRQLLVIAGAMHHFLGNDHAALDRFKEALPLKFVEPGIPAEQSARHDEYLTELIKDYVAKLEKGEPVPDSKADK